MTAPGNYDVSLNRNLNISNRPFGGMQGTYALNTIGTQFANLNSAVANRATFNPYSNFGRQNSLAPVSLRGFNGNPETAYTWGAGPFRNTIEMNIANNTFSNGYNNSRNGINYDYRGFRANDVVDPRLQYAYNPNRYSNGFPYNYANVANYRGVAPYASVDPQVQRYANGFAVLGQYADGYPYQQVNGIYPAVPPECTAYLPCANTPDPAACIATSVPGGPRHCAPYLRNLQNVQGY